MTTTDARAPVGLDLGYARVSTTKQSLGRQLDAVAGPRCPSIRAQEASWEA